MSSNVWPKEPYKGYAPFWEAVPDHLFATVLALEAGGESEVGRQGVSQVIMNRLTDIKRRFGNGLYEVLLRKYAFSCLNPSYILGATQVLKDPPEELVHMAIRFLDGSLTCPVVDGATHYLNPKTAKFANAKDDWRNSDRMIFICTTGRHAFYKEL